MQENCNGLKQYTTNKHQCYLIIVGEKERDLQAEIDKTAKICINY